jgi:hypothetical protein
MPLPSAPTPVSIRTCGHDVLPRRKCDLCLSGADARPFVACSLACLKEHLEVVHGSLRSSASRAAKYQTHVNRQTIDFRDRYAAHRAHLMQVLGSAGSGGELCVLGAGNCSDLDPEQLARDFSKIHLVDLDGEALERGRESFAPDARDRVLIHAGLDLSGFLDRLDAWGEDFPDPIEFNRSATLAIQALIARIGQNFRVVLSDCILSQLPLAYRHNWLMPDAHWQAFNQSLIAVHLATLVGCAAPGGQGVIAFDVIDSAIAPSLRGIAADDTKAMENLVRERAAQGTLTHPSSMLQWLKSPALGPLVASAELTPPWLWNTGDTHLVYGLVLQRTQTTLELPSPAGG